jgi:hypothetical protein
MVQTNRLALFRAYGPAKAAFHRSSQHYQIGVTLGVFGRADDNGALKEIQNQCADNPESRAEKEFFRSMRPSPPLLKRFATAEEIAAMVVYVFSTRASARQSHCAIDRARSV